jgi:glucose 1-dehydrogenase
MTEAAEALARRELTPIELTQSCLARIESVDGALRAWVTVDEERAIKPALELTLEDFVAIFSVDVRASFLLSKEGAPLLREHGGSIVNVTSVHEHVPRPGFLLYAAAKAALGMRTTGRALERASEGIRGNAVAPGAIATGRNVEAEELAAEIPLGRPGTPEEVAALVSWLVSDEAGYVTGASIVIDGGAIQHVLPPAF